MSSSIRQSYKNVAVEIEEFIEKEKNPVKQKVGPKKQNVNPIKQKSNTCNNNELKLEISPKNVRQGFVWSIILGEPVSKKRR